MKNDGDCFCGVLGGQGGRRRVHDEHVNFETDELINQDRKAVRLSLRVSVLESYIPALNKPECADLLTE
jgi:hypothetical protein